MQERVGSCRSVARIAQGDPRGAGTKRLGLAKASFEAALRNMRELAEMAGGQTRRRWRSTSGRSRDFDEIRSAIAQKRAGGAGES